MLIFQSNLILSQKNDLEKEGVKTAIEHKNEKWYKWMQQPNCDYFKVKKSFEKFINKNPLEGSAPREFGLSWLKSNLFYLDKNGKVQDKPIIDYNKIENIAGISSDSFSGDWRMLGPVNTLNGPNAGGGNNGGYAYCVRMDPYNTNKLFCSFLTGGLWVSTDNGVNWRLTDANLPANEYLDIDVAKSNTSIVYAVCANAVIKSTDGGLTWYATSLNSTNFSGKGYDICVSPTDANVLIARWNDNLYRTTDGGVVWKIVKTGLTQFSVYSNLNSEMLDWDINNSNIVYTTDRGNNQNYVDVYKSIDAGLSFTLFKTLNIPAAATGKVTGWSKISTSTNSPKAVHILFGTGDNAYSHVAVQMFKLDINNGNILTQRTNMVNGLNTSYGSTTALHHGDIALDLNDDNNIVWGSYSQQNVQYSTDNGMTFKTSTSFVHSDLRSLHFVNGKVMLGTDGSAYISNDNGNNISIVTQSISNHELWGFGASFKSNILAAGTNHGPLMVRETDSKNGWFTLLGADQGNSDINPLDSISVYSQGYDSYHVTLKGNKTYTNGTQQIDPGGIYSYFNSMEFHPHLYHTLITHHAGQYPNSVDAATKSIWKNSLIRSDDNGLTVNVLHTFSDQVFREKICVKDTNRIYAVIGLANNRLMKTLDGGKNWIDITPNTTTTGTTIRNISDIAVGELNPDELWISYSGVQNTCKVLYSSDGGVSYSNITQSILTTFPITKIISQRGTNGGVYVGSRSGVYFRSNTSTNWTKLGNGLPECDIRFMFINYYNEKLLIGTDRGAWEHNLQIKSSSSAQISADTDVPNCQNPIVQFRDYSVVSSAGIGVKYQWSFPGGTPSTSTLESPLVSYLGTATGRYSVSLTVTDQNGTSTQTLPNFIKYTAVNCCENPSGWATIDIGNQSSPGQICYTPDDKNFKIKCKNQGIGGLEDNFPFIYKILIGDGEIKGRVKNVTDIWNYGAGFMIRKSLNSNSSFVLLNALDSRGVFDLFRLNDGNNTGYNLVTALAMPMWLRLKRVSNQITCFHSIDGTNWTLYRTLTLNLNNSAYIGIAVSGADCISNIDNVSVIGNTCTPPQIIDEIKGTATVCEGDSIKLELLANGNGLMYQWKFNNLNIGTNSNFLKIPNGTQNNSGNYNCLISNACGADTAVVFNVKVNLSLLATITKIGNVLTASQGDSYQWKLNGIIIQGANQKTYTFTKNGDYTVIITQNGCMKESNSFKINVAAENLIETENIVIYPNPVSNTLTINIEFKKVEEGTLEIVDVLGKKLFQETLKSSKIIQKNIDFSKFEKGIYYLKITNKNMVLTKEIIKE